MTRDLRGVVRAALGGGAGRGRLGGHGGPPLLDLKPATAYEAQTRQLVEDLRRELDEIKARLNGLLFLVAGALVVDVVLRLSR